MQRRCLGAEIQALDLQDVVPGRCSELLKATEIVANDGAKATRESSMILLLAYMQTIRASTEP